MIEGAIWRKWVFFYVPMGLFLLFLLFPFYWMVITSVRPDGELYRPWNSVNYNPFWTWKPTWDHVKYLFEETLFASWLWNTTFIALASTAISLVCGVFAGYALSRLNFPFAGSLGTGIFITYLVPQTLLFIPLAELIRGDVFYWGPLMAGALLGSIPVAIAYSFFVEHYVAGLTGSVKG